MYKNLALTTAMIAGLAGTSAALAQPANDECSGAAAVLDGSNALSNALATFDTANPCSTNPAFGDAPGNADVWYTYTAPVTGLRNFEITNDPFGGYGFALSIYDGCGGALLACDYLGSGVGNYMSKVYQLPVTAGHVYKIQIAGVFGATGAGALRIYAPPAPSTVAGDECSNAVVVTGQPMSVPFNTAGLSPTDPRAWDYPMTSDGWFAWTPSESGIGYISGCGFTSTPAGIVTPRLSIQDGCGQIPLTYFSNFRETSTSPSSCLPTACFEATAGQTYYIRYSAAEDARNISGTMRFEIRQREGGGIAIPPGALAEPGSCGDASAADLNGGCFVTPPAYTPYQLCEVYSGTGSSRKDPIAPLSVPARLSVDADWYVFTLNADQDVTVTGQSEFPPLAAIMATCSTDPFGTGGVVIKQTVFRNDCSGVYDLNRSGTPAAVLPFTTTLVAGTYYFVISPLVDGYSSSTCGHGDRYWFRITGSEPCPPALERCCRGTTCVEVASGTCTGTVAGSASVVVGSCTGSTIAGCCYGDYDHNATRDVSDIFAFLSAWFSASPYARVGGDGTGTPTVADIFSFLSSWFAGCN